MTAKGLKIDLPGDGTMKIASEGAVKKLVNEVYEKTFSGDEAVKRGQKVYYITERAVFRRTARHPVLELIEIAPGIDLQKDVLDQMEFAPAISPNLKTMDSRIFQKDAMNMGSDLFGTLADRCKYHEKDHNLYIDLFGITLNSEADVVWFMNSLKDIMKPYVDDKGPLDVVANYRVSFAPVFGHAIH
jgi:propionate CoA-transferase